MAYAVGQDLFSLCGKCDATWHVIVAMDGSKVTRVQCKHCMGYHRYRVAPGEEDVNKKAAALKKKTTTRRRVSVAARGVSRASASLASGVEADMSRPVRQYTMRDTYAPGDRIDHPKFGRGVVQGAPDATKVQVQFPGGDRTLAQGR